MESPFAVKIPEVLQDVFLIEKDNKRFPGTKGWAYAVFDYDPASDAFKPNATGVVTCGFACHTRVAAKDYIFTALRQKVNGASNASLITSAAAGIAKA
jgi:hypothetical protein